MRQPTIEEIETRLAAAQGRRDEYDSTLTNSGDALTRNYREQVEHSLGTAKSQIFHLTTLLFQRGQRGAT
jgi:hypothetical protein